jgi:hypothetical protein
MIHMAAVVKKLLYRPNMEAVRNCASRLLNTKIVESWAEVRDAFSSTEDWLLVPAGYYRHFKGNLYRVHFVGRLENSLEVVVVYEAMYANDSSSFWVRPISEFIGEAVSGKIGSNAQLPRFKRIRSLSEVSEVEYQHMVERKMHMDFSNILLQQFTTDGRTKKTSLK